MIVGPRGKVYASPAGGDGAKPEEAGRKTKKTGDKLEEKGDKKDKKHPEPAPVREGYAVARIDLDERFAAPLSASDPANTSQANGHRALVKKY